MFFVFILLFSLSFFLTAAMVRLATRTALLDMPNHRSAHQLPTPRGGGVAIVTVFFLTVLFAVHSGILAVSAWPVYLLAVFLVASIGFIDDFRNMGVLSRLLVQTGSVILCVCATFYTNSAFFVQVGIGFAVMIAAIMVVAGVWLINLYNFMDGIDGIAGLQALFVSSAMAMLFYMSDHQDLFLISLGVAAGTSGFLCWNLPKAKIFMGDAGSGGLGIIFFVLILCSVHTNISYLTVWLILLSVFWVDATFTLLVRLFTGQRIFSAHNLHAYQKLTKKCGSHFRISMLVTIFNLFWVAPLAFLTYYQSLSALTGIALACLPVFLACVLQKAGFVESTVSD